MWYVYFGGVDVRRLAKMSNRIAEWGLITSKKVYCYKCKIDYKQDVMTILYQMFLSYICMNATTVHAPL